MVRKLAAVITLLLALGMSIMPVAAQDVSVDDMQDFGLESGHVRMFVADPSAAGTPSPVLGVMVGGVEFDTADHAADYFEDFTCGFISGFVSTDASDCDGLEDAGITLNKDIEINKAPAIEAMGDADISGPMPVTLLAIQDENYIYLVITLGVKEEGVGDELGGFLVDAEPSDAEVVFSDDGTSTGGIYDMMPQTGDPVLHGMLPALDQELFGDLSSTPAA